MSEYRSAMPGLAQTQETVCVSTQKIMDACRDQDCSENVPVYLTVDSQQTLEHATSVKGRSAELIYGSVTVTPAQYRSGYYSVECQYYYRVIADAVTCGVRPVTVYGLATTCGQAVLYGGTGGASTFTSDGGPARTQPVGVVDAVDPVVLCAAIVNLSPSSPAPEPLVGEIPPEVAGAFDDALVFTGMERQLQVTLGQFSILRLERQAQLLISGVGYSIPEKSSPGEGGSCQETPCEAFAKMQFPVGEFFPHAQIGGGEDPEPLPEAEVLTAQKPVGAKGR